MEAHEAQAALSLELQAVEGKAAAQAADSARKHEEQLQATEQHMQDTLRATQQQMQDRMQAVEQALLEKRQAAEQELKELSQAAQVCLTGSLPRHATKARGAVSISLCRWLLLQCGCLAICMHASVSELLGLYHAASWRQQTPPAASADVCKCK